MQRSDAAFLEEVEDFLVSFDLLTFPTLPALTDGENSDEASPKSATSTTKADPEPVVCKKSSKRSRIKLDPAAKRALEREKDRNRRSAYRERRRIEKEALRQQVGELTTELTELQKAKEADAALASTAWEMVVKRQLQARVNAEEKQRRLLRAVEVRATWIQGVQEFLHNRFAQGDDDEVGAEVLTTSYKQKRIRIEPSDAEFYEAFLRELDSNYAKTDDALRMYGLESTDPERTGLKQQWKSYDEEGYYVYTDKYVLPFKFEQVCALTWRVAQMHHRQEDRVQYEGLKEAGNVVAFKFRVTTRLQSGRTVSVLQRAAVLRCVEDGRSIIMWRSFTEGEGIFTGMHADESGWCVAIPLSGSPEPRTLVRTIMRNTPMHFSSKLDHDPDTKQFTNVVLDAGTEDAAEITSRLERLLLEEK